MVANNVRRMMRFNSRPREEATTRRKPGTITVARFNSRPREEATRAVPEQAVHAQFQLTPP